MSIDWTLSPEGIATITINRPEAMNALDADHYKALSAAWIEVRDNKAVRVAVVTGAGDKSFCAGADLKSVVTVQADWADNWLTQRDQLLNRGLEVWKPVIAAVNGYCLGGGVTMLYGTDIRVASETATFGLSEVKRGIIAANGGTQRTLKQLPYCLGMEFLLTGDRIDAATARDWGLINKVVPPDQLMDAALDYADRIAANGPLAVQASKELAVRSFDMDLTTGLRMEAMVSRALRETEDAKEGPKAFREKRKPEFKGR
ncbi:enoyl-CoA hydratase/isomerase family protein [Pseudooceanicola sp. 216_PA32_1]|uniref:Enoyl-CoA hydratase/isomerase family protein n=1 Tax=Pseudooceanicola pacificus TaxID=2676438 RepID=A0A844VZW6_9RHOB|nr:enoyl-CoA hydratase-related protein [Pseudooceanicola pacificus]MWB77346.1 enoyl-CoA hydratase/isomerase family protein [Pseudooceanicola pacificus]